MARRATDPTARRLRNFVLLVIFAVALPSLLLTGFGLIAISNERAAAVERVHDLYAPVLRRLAERIQGDLHAMAAEAGKPLDILTAWGRREIALPSERYLNLLADSILGTNLFVLDADGEILVPRQETPPSSWQGYLPDPFRKGLDLEFRKRDAAGAAGVYRALLTQPIGQGDSRCLILNALARSLGRTDAGAERRAALAQIIEGCAAFVDATGYNLSLGASLELLKLDASAPNAARLAGRLTDPTLPASAGQVELNARMALDFLAPIRDRIPRDTLERLEAIGQRSTVLAALRDRMGSASGQPEVRALWVDGQRRLFLLRGGDHLAGWQLVPSVLDARLAASLEDLEIDPNIHARIRPTDEPVPDDDAGILAGSLPLRETGRAWRLDLILSGSDALDRLAKSRARLYFWALLLLIVALVLGIGRTVSVMIRETRLSRLKTDFVSSVSHELRTPLTSIRMFTETLLLGRVRDKDEERECLQTIGQETERLSRLVERILDFSRMEAGRKAFRFEPQPVGELVRDAVAACRPMSEERDFEIRVDVPGTLPDIQVDRDAMVEVLINLLSNAIKYSPRGRVVEIAARSSAERVNLSVRDEGVGIPASERKKIFEKFYRVDMPLAAEVPGSGLGLSLVHYIVKAHQGEIRVESTEGQGSTFTVDLPVRPTVESGREAS